MEGQNHPNHIADDPIVKSWKVFYNPHPDDERRLYLLQYLTRKTREPLSRRHKKQNVLEFRLKPNTGHVELDFNVDTEIGYDKERGRQYGIALSESGLVESGGSYGLAGGFSVQSNTKGRLALNDQSDSVLSGLANAVFSKPLNLPVVERLYNKQTLGGQAMPKDPYVPTYLLGVLDEDGLHLTPVDAIVQMTPQLHQVDAEVDHERLAKRGQREAAEPRDPVEPRAVQVTVKHVDGDEIDFGDSIRAIAQSQQEEWTRMTYHEEKGYHCKKMQDEFLKIQSPATVPSLRAAQGKDKYLDAVTSQNAGSDAKIWGWSFSGERGSHPRIEEADPVEHVDIDINQTTLQASRPRARKSSQQPKSEKKRVGG